MFVALKIIVDILCGVLNAIGGYCWHNARRYIMPVLLGGEAGLIAWEKNKKDWWAGLLVLPVIGTLVLGYKNFGTGNFSRAMWLFLQAVVIGLGLTITGHVAWYFYLPYIVGAGVLGGIYKDWQQILGDFIAGIYLGIIIYFVK